MDGLQRRRGAGSQSVKKAGSPMATAHRARTQRKAYET
jgi:hypothetical protein